MHRKYIVYRVLARLNEQAEIAYRYGRKQDSSSLSMLVGRLEYLHFRAVGFEHSLNAISR